MSLDYTTPETPCPSCRSRINRAGGGSGRPSPGDYSICIYCLAPLIFTDDLGLRMMTEEDWERAPDEVKALIARAREILFREFLKETRH